MRLFGLSRERRGPVRWTLVMALAALVLAACGQPKVVAPTIAAFEASPAVIDAGGSSELSWIVKGDYKEIRLLAGGVQVAAKLPAQGERVVNPDATTEYSLVVTPKAAGATVRKSVTVTVVTPPDGPVVLGLTLDETDAVDLEVGDTHDIGFTLSVEEGADVGVQWTVGGDEGVLSVSPESTDELSGNVTVTAVGAGSATLIGTTVGVDADGEPVTATVEFNVTVAPGTPVALDLDLDQSGPVGLDAGDTQDVGFTLSVEDGASTTVNWTVSDGAVLSVAPASTTTTTGTVTITALAAGSATLTGTTVGLDSAGDPITASVVFNVTAVVVPPAITSVAVEVVEGSQFTATWAATGADEFDVVAVNPSDPDDVEAVPGGAALAGTATSATLGIPSSTHQLIRVVARNAGGEVSMDAAGVLENVVLNTQDSDPYNTRDYWHAEPEVPGSLRNVINNAPAGAVIGFAADVVAAGEIEIYGVEIDTWGDAHLYFGRDVTLSGPASGLTIRARSAFEPGDPGDPYTYRSRVLFVAAGVDATVENLTLTGGDFIFTGGGIRNLGTLTLNGVTVTGNHAWYTGGGISNAGTLVVNDSVISDNTAGTYESEVGTSYIIRGNPDPEAQTGNINPGGWGAGVAQRDAGANATFTNVTFSGNVTRRYGGALYTEDGAGPVSVSGGSVVSNQANVAYFLDVASAGPEGVRAGGILVASAVTMDGVLFDGNDATGNASSGAGGAIGVVQTGTAVLTSSQVNNNTADYGGGILVWTCTTVGDVLTTSGVTYSGNSAREAGGQDDLEVETLACVAQAGRTGAVVSDAGLPTNEQMLQMNSR